MTIPVQARYALRGIGYVVAYVVFGTLASAVATVFGVFFVFILGMGLSGIVAVVALPFVPLIGIPIGFALSMPVTFLLLPVLALLLKHRPATSILVFSITAALTGGCVTWWWVGLSKTFSGIALELVISGFAAGAVAGMAYAAMVRAVQH